MQTTYQPLTENSPVEFIVKGFPIEEDIRADIENFYKTQSGRADRRFLVYNTFKEIIFSGTADAEGNIEEFTFKEREGKN